MPLALALIGRRRAGEFARKQQVKARLAALGALQARLGAICAAAEAGAAEAAGAGPAGAAGATAADARAAFLLQSVCGAEDGARGDDAFSFLKRARAYRLAKLTADGVGTPTPTKQPQQRPGQRRKLAAAAAAAKVNALLLQSADDVGVSDVFAASELLMEVLGLQPGGDDSSGGSGGFEFNCDGCGEEGPWEGLDDDCRMTFAGPRPFPLPAATAARYVTAAVRSIAAAAAADTATADVAQPPPPLATTLTVGPGRSCVATL